MPKKRVADIARERGLEPAEVARRLAEAGVKLSGDAVDEAAAARALGGSRPARSKIAAVAAAPPRVPVPTAPVGSSASLRGGAERVRPPTAPRAPRLRALPARPARLRAPAAASTARASPRAAAPGRVPARARPARCLRGSRAPSAQAPARPRGRRRRVVIDTGAARPQRDTRNQGRGRGRGGHAPDKREEPVARRVPSTVPLRRHRQGSCRRARASRPPSSRRR